MERTWPAKNRIKFDVIDFFFQEDPCMDLTFTLIWNLSPEMHADKIQQKQFLCQIALCSFEFLSFDNFFFQSSCYQWFCNFSVKSSWEVRWIIMFQKDKVWSSAISLTHFFFSNQVYMMKLQHWIPTHHKILEVQNHPPKEEVLEGGPKTRVIELLQHQKLVICV